MSKDIARTIGSTRGILIALVALAIAAAAVLSTTWSAQAASTDGNRLNGAPQVSEQPLPPFPDSDALLELFEENLVLRHIDDDGDIIGSQDVNNNVRGSRHTVCLFLEDFEESSDPQSTYRPVNIGNVLTHLIDYNPGGHAVGDPFDGPPTTTNENSFVGEEGDSEDASCFSWISNRPGDQEINLEIQAGVTFGIIIGVIIDDVDESDVVVPQLPEDSDIDPFIGVLFSVTLDQGFQVDWCGEDDDQEANCSIIKQWNDLRRSEIIIDGVSQLDDEGNPLQDVDLNFTLLQLPNGEFVIPGGSIGIEDLFHGDHVDITGGIYDTFAAGTSLAGVEWEVTLAGCGDLDGDLTGTTELESTGGDEDDEPIVENFPDFSFNAGAGADNCDPNDTAVITIEGCEPGPQGSGVGACIIETITINFDIPLDQKRVLLAWAGQRVVLEVDWRLPPGDDVNGDPLGFCPFFEQNGNSTDQQSSDFFGLIRYQKIAGNGGFVPGLGAFLADQDVAFVELGGDDDNFWPGQGPNDGCISRVLYESEQPGQEDIEVFWDPEIGPSQDAGQVVNATKVAIVIYYMKIEDVKTSLVTGVEKPSHNSSDPAYADWSPGNPWDERDDVTEAEWNVSKDLLVRVRVRGWFVNENPSGRPQEGEFGENVRPVNRWIMPDDWALLAGGPGDGPGDEVRTGTAEDFSQHYDIVWAPWVDGCPTLDDPAGGVIHGALCASESSLPFVGPYSLVELPALDQSGALFVGGGVYDSQFKDGDINRYDAPMPPAELSVRIRGTGFIKEVLKQDVYWTGVVNDPALQNYPNPYYLTHIPASPFIPNIVAGGGYRWDTWGGDGAYTFWQPVIIGSNAEGVVDPTLIAADQTELAAIRVAYDDPTVARDLVVYTDNHGEAMVAANGDFKLTYEDCAINQLFGGYHCEQGDEVGDGSILAVANYPDFRGKHPAVTSNTSTVTWTWGGYKDVRIYDDPAGNNQFKFVVFHALDRDGFCDPTLVPGAVSLHPVLSLAANDTFNGNPAETVDFLIDAGEGIIIETGYGGTVNTQGNRQFAEGVLTFLAGTEGGPQEFPFSPLAGDGQATECQAWVKVSNSLLGIVDFLVIAHDDEGDIGFDRIIDLQDTASYTLNFRWSLITWAGANNIPVEDALKGTGSNEEGNDIFDQVTAVYGWNQQGQDWLGYFPAGVSVPGANDLTSLSQGQAYWIAIKAPGPVTWTIATDVGP